MSSHVFFVFPMDIKANKICRMKVYYIRTMAILSSFFFFNIKRRGVQVQIAIIYHKTYIVSQIIYVPMFWIGWLLHTTINPDLKEMFID